MARRIIVVEDSSDDATQMEQALNLLNNSGFKAYQLSTIFNNPQDWSVATQPLEFTAQVQDDLISSVERNTLETLLNQKNLLEDELRKYRTLLENSGDLIYALDFGGNITFVTNNVFEIMGYQPEEVLGQNFMLFTPWERHNTSVKAFNELLSQTKRNTFRTNILKKDGTRLPVEISARTYHEDGVPVLQIGLVRDITQRKQMEAEMLKRNRELSALYSVASALTSSLDLETLLDECLGRMMVAMSADSGCIFLLNENGEFRQGTQRGLDASFRKIFTPLWNNWQPLEQAMRRGETVIVEDLTKLTQIDPELLLETGYRSIALGPLRANNTTLGTFMLLSKGTQTFTLADRDLLLSLGGQVGLALQTGMLYSELNKTILELRQTNKRLDDATRHKSEFLANMSHELRTPLNAIIGFSEVLYDQTFGPLNNKQLRFVDNILNSGKHLLALVNDVLDLSKVEAGKMQLDLEELNPLDSINEALANLNTLAQKKQITLSSKRLESVPPTLMADRSKLKQILYNLYSNAIKFTPDGGNVETETRTVYKPEGVYLQINITDNGIGIAPEDQERIFEEFQMVDSTLSKRQQGTGLGLALCRKLTEMHGGTITVKSTLGKGSTFTLTLPLVTDVPNLPKEPLSSGESLLPFWEGEAWQEQMQRVLKEGAGNLVLIVEDDDKSAELLELYVTQSGYKVERSRSGEEALQKARTLHPALITLDIILPHKNGWDVLRELKADPDTSDIPVLVVSMMDSREISFQLGAVAFFVKPVQRDEFLSKISAIKQEALHRKRQKHFEQHLMQGQPLQALVIDNDTQDTEFMSKILQQAGLSVTTAASGLEGWQRTLQTPPDLVVLDLLLPDTDEFNVLASLRQNPATFDVPVVVFTAKDLNADERGRLSDQTEAIFQKGTQGRQQLLDEILKLSSYKK